MLRNVCKAESTKKYNSGNENHPSQEDLTEIDSPFKKRKVKLISFSVILYLQENKIMLITLIIITLWRVDIGVPSCCPMPAFLRGVKQQ